MEIIKGSIYKHFKGHRYVVLHCDAKDSETLEELVVYQDIENPEKIWVRPKSMWFEEIVRDGNTYQRFTIESGI